MSHKGLAVFAVHNGFSLFGYGVARDLIRMANDTGSNVQIEAVTAAALTGPVRSSCGAAVLADQDLSAISGADYVFLCSSRDLFPAKFPAAVLANLRACHRHGGWVIGLGTSIFALGEAGLLTGRRATAHPAQLSVLEDAFPETQFTFQPFLIDQRIATCVGGDAVIDMMLELLSRAFDPAIAENVRRHVLLKPERSEDLVTSIGLEGSLEDLDPRLARYILLVEQTLSAPMPLDEVCASLAISARTLSRLTHTAFHCAPGELSTRIRLTYAASLLKSSTKSLPDIAEASGYRSTSHFSEAFNAHFGIRPGTYRACHKRSLGHFDQSRIALLRFQTH